MKFIMRNQRIFFFLLCTFFKILSDPLYLNNANPFPLFSSEGRYDRLSSISRKKIKEFILNGEDIEYIKDDKIFHANIMPYIQIATSGTNYEGKNVLVYTDNRNQSMFPLNTSIAIEAGTPPMQQAPSGAHPTANLVRSVPMPLGAIPEPWNFFALFYENNPANPIEPKVYKNGNLLQAEYDYNADEKGNQDPIIEAQQETSVPNDSSNFNQVSKIVARYLGYNDTPFQIADNQEMTTTNANDIGLVIPNQLMYDYSNYKNNYFGLLQYPPSRDPKKLFGYGYYNCYYQKVGMRGTFEWKLNYDFSFKIYTGFSNLDISQINIIDTTINYQGPTGALMFARYPDQIYQLQTNTSPNAPGPYISPNTYQLTDYSTPVMDNTTNAAFNSNFYNSSELTNFMPDEFKSAFLQNVQYNLDSLGALINQSFRPYSAQSFDDTTFELSYRKLIVYNKSKEPYKNDQPIEHTPFTLMPTASAHVTCPIAPRAPSNKIFSKPLDNNGHWELGINGGIEFDFINNIVFGGEVGVSWYNGSDYYNVPVPTNQFNEGIYLYNANVLINPGFSYTASLGMQVDELFKCVDFFIEYRLVRHAEDDFIIKQINNLLPVKYMEDTHTSPESDNNDTLDTIPNGILYVNYNKSLPYPTQAIIGHMKETSSWMVNMFNMTCNVRIHEDMKIGFAWQQPFLLRNAYNATTLGISFEMYL